MWLLFKWYYHQAFSKEKIDAHFEPISSKYGIKIVYKIENDFFSPLENPPIPAGPPRYSNVEPIRHRVLLRYPVLLQKAFNKYPIEVVKKYLNAIYFANDIDADGRKAAGTYDPFRRIIYLVDNGTQNDDLAMSTIHHELSSLFLKRHSFFINSWEDHNPRGFKYLDDIYDDWKTIKKIRNTISDHDCYEKGIVANYGLTNFENDFNEYSEMIFTYPNKFKKIMEKYPRVRGKFKVWLEFYQRIDPIFTEKYLFGPDEVGDQPFQAGELSGV
jgi:hypothetical protein